MQDRTTKITRGDRLQVALLNLEVGQQAEIPFKLYSANTIHSMAAQLKAGRGLVYEVNTRGEKTAIVTRIR